MPNRTSKPVKKRSGGDHTRKAYRGIRNMMLHNELTAGQKISYRDLSERLGMSQTPIIQALKWLEFKQLVRHEPNRGYFTALIDRREVEEVYQTRELIELSLLAAIIKHIDDAGLKKLRLSLEAHLEASRELYLSDRLKKDMAFHLTLAALSGNRVQGKILADLFDLLYLKYSGNMLFSTSMEAADTDHQELYECIAARDLKAARRTLSRHIQRVRQHVLQGLAKITAEKDLAGL
ncbi:MAG: GntR family transcriptional regulator [Desulfosarcina sp.]|nr:GntR family transcriptional regulator [Desulfobacterales bacterium]